MIKNYKVLEYLEENYINIILIGLIWIIGIITCIFEFASRIYQFGLWGCIITTFGSIVIIEVSKLIERYTKTLKKVFCWYGKNSMNIVIFHYIEIVLSKYIFPYESIKFNSLVLKSICISMIKLTIVTSLTAVFQKIESITKKIYMKKLVRGERCQEI